VVVSEEKARRIFIAVPVPGEVRAALADRLSEVEIPGRVVLPENWHLTLRFLGWADRVGYERALAALDSADLGARFRIALGAMGAFPRPGNASVIWLDVIEGLERLTELAEVSEEAARVAGFQPEERPFRVHLTLSRVRPTRDVRPLVEGFPAVGIGWRCESVVVYESHLARGGARYEALEAFPLSG
jgi:2'-5' RNA ligase